MTELDTRPRPDGARTPDRLAPRRRRLQSGIGGAALLLTATLAVLPNRRPIAATPKTARATSTSTVGAAASQVGAADVPKTNAGPSSGPSHDPTGVDEAQPSRGRRNAAGAG